MDQGQAQQELAFIRQMMQSARRATYVSGAFFILWSLITGLGLLGTWLLTTGKLTLLSDPGIATFWLWMALDMIGLAGTVLIIRRNRRMAQAVANPAGRLIGLSWFAVAAGILIVAIVGIGSGSISGDVMCAISAVFIGIGVFNSGLLADLKWLRNLAFGWWVGGGLMLAAPGLWNLWFMALLLFLLYFIPGFVLSRRARV
jgi:hypothetical protein